MSQPRETIRLMDATEIAVIASAVATCATFVVLAVTLWYAAKQVRHAQAQVDEAQRLRREQFRPWVVVDLYFRQALAYIKVENLGNTVARDVRVTFDQPLLSISEPEERVDEAKFLADGIPTLPPGKRYSVFFDSMFSRFADNTLPRSYRATVTYKDAAGIDLGPEEFIVDFDLYYDNPVPEKGIPELVQEVKGLKKELHKWTDGQGLQVHTVNRYRKRARELRPYHLRRIKEHIGQGHFAKAATYVVREVRRKFGLWTR